MKFEIEGNVINRTDKCRKNFSCLNGKADCLCEVLHMIGNSLIFIKPPEGKVCDYMTPFGGSHYCNCPTRMEIHRLYSLNNNDISIALNERD